MIRASCYLLYFARRPRDTGLDSRACTERDASDRFSPFRESRVLLLRSFPVEPTLESDSDQYRRYYCARDLGVVRWPGFRPRCFDSRGRSSRLWSRGKKISTKVRSESVSVFFLFSRRRPGRKANEHARKIWHSSRRDTFTPTTRWLPRSAAVDRPVDLFLKTTGFSFRWDDVDNVDNGPTTGFISINTLQTFAFVICFRNNCFRYWKK